MSHFGTRKEIQMDSKSFYFCSKQRLENYTTLFQSSAAQRIYRHVMPDFLHINVASQRCKLRKLECINEHIPKRVRSSYVLKNAV